MLRLLLQNFETTALELAAGGLTSDQLASAFALSSLLEEMGEDTTAICTACGDPHEGEVEKRLDPLSGKNRHYVRCPTLLRTPIHRESLLRWRIRTADVAASIARAVGTTGDVQIDVADRVWFLGRATIGRRPFEVFLARGFTWLDAPSILGAARLLLASRSPLVVVPGAAPAEGFWGGRVPEVVSLATIATWDGAHIVSARDHLAATYGLNPRQRAAPTVASFPTPPGCTWADIHIAMAPDGMQDRVLVTAKGRRKEFTFQEAGFGDGRSNGARPNQNWAMLRAFAGEGGVIPVDSTALTSKQKTKQAVHAFREAIQRWIPDVDGSPVDHDPARNAYVCAFHIGSAQGTRFPLPAEVTTWDDIGIGVRPDGIVVAAAAGIRRRIVEWTGDNDGDERPSGAAGVVPDTISHLYSYVSLGLLDEDGNPTPALKALGMLAKGKGSATGADDDQGFLALSGVLTRLIGINGSPPLDFQKAGRSGRWIAQFEILPGR